MVGGSGRLVDRIAHGDFSPCATRPNILMRSSAVAICSKLPLNDSPTQIVMIDLSDLRLNMELTFNRGVSHGAACLPVKVAHAFIGVHNEHFLHNRSRGRGDHSCRILGSAPLNSAF